MRQNLNFYAATSLIFSQLLIVSFLTPMFSLLAVTAQVWRHFCCCTLLVERNNMCVLVWWRVSVAAGLVHQWLKAASSGSLGHDTAAASTDCTSSTDWAGTDWLWCGGTGPLPPSPPSLSLVTAGAPHRPTRLVWLCVILHTNNVVLWATLFNRNFDHTTIMIELSAGLVIMYAMNQELVNITIRQLWWIINLGIIYSEITLWHLSLNAKLKSVFIILKFHSFGLPSTLLIAERHTHREMTAWGRLEKL